MTKNFDLLRKSDVDGVELWSARELMVALGYKRWDDFKPVLVSAMQTCTNSGLRVDDHFRNTPEVITAGKGAKGSRMDWLLTRYGAYVLAMSGDSRKEEIALAKTYFAQKTRQRELDEDTRALRERADARMHLASATSLANEAAKNSGVENYQRFNGLGHFSMYTMNVAQTKAYKKLDKTANLRDHMGIEELAANLFRKTQTDVRLRESKIDNEDAACAVSMKVGEFVRAAMKQSGGVYPEDLKPEISLKTLQRAEKKALSPNSRLDVIHAEIVAETKPKPKQAPFSDNATLFEGLD